MKITRASALVLGGLAGYGLYEPRRFRLTRLRVPLGGPLAGLTVLHVSDPHLHAGAMRVYDWMTRLPEELGSPPDLVLATGDFIENDSGIDPLLEAFAGLEARVGRYYVLGSHDYYQSRFRLPTKYFTGPTVPSERYRAATHRLEEGLRSKGWIALTNTGTAVDTDRGRIRLAGVDDPHLKRHRTDHIRREPGDALAIGLMHTPDLVSEWVLAGFDLVLAGHTHAGQVRLPLAGAVVTNCSLPTGLAGGLHRVGAAYLHVSPGLGNGRYSPIRLRCRPEASLLTIN